MKNNARHIYLLLVLLFSSTIIYSVNTIPTNLYNNIGGWVKLGKHKVGEGVSYEEFTFSEEKSNVKRLKIKVHKSSVYIMSVKVIYKDKTSEDHNISRRLDKGDSTRALDLIGHYRTIEKIIFIYRGNSNKGGAELMVLAKL